MPLNSIAKEKNSTKQTFCVSMRLLMSSTRNWWLWPHQVHANRQESFQKAYSMFTALPASLGFVLAL